MKDVTTILIVLETSFSYEDKRLRITPIMENERNKAIISLNIKTKLKIP